MKLSLKWAEELVEKLAGIAGMVWTVNHFVQGFMGKKVPDDAHPAAKGLSEGGIRSADDQIIMDQIEEQLAEAEKLLFSGFKTWIREGYGDGLLGRTLNYFYWERFRSFVIRMRTPERVIAVTRSIKTKGGGEVKRDRKVPPSNAQAVGFLKRLIGEIQVGIDGTTGSKSRKTKAGYARACAYLQNKSFPLPSFIDRAKSVDAALRGAPNSAANAGIIIKGVAQKAAELAGTTYGGVGSWIDQEHDKLEERNNREGALTGFRRWYRSLL